jgi:hypothetical protein
MVDDFFKKLKDSISQPSNPEPIVCMDEKSRLGIDTILRFMPKNLGTVEPELQAAPIRTEQWFSRNGSEQRWAERELNGWHAHRGWVCQCVEVPDYEGPDYHIVVAWIYDNRTYQKYFKIGYDTYHWAVSTPQHYGWFHDIMKCGNPLTLLINPDDHSEAHIFGQFEAFVKIDGRLSWVAE